MKNTNFTYLKEEIKQKDKEIKQKDKEIKQLKLTIKKLKQELLKENNNNKIVPFKYKKLDWEYHLEILSSTSCV